MRYISSRAILAFSRRREPHGHRLEELLQFVSPEVFYKTDNEHGMTALAVAVMYLSQYRALEVFDACPQAMCVYLPEAGSALHVLLKSSHPIFAILTHILGTLEERDFFFHKDRYGDNVMHVAAASSLPREVVELLRATMPSSVNSEVNRAGLTPLEICTRNGRSQLGDLFSSTSMAKRADC